jgi:long-chain acyl-CoA synthetase
VQESLADIVRTTGTPQADKVAIEFEGRSVTYGELDRRSSQVANALLSEGVEEQTCVGFLDKNCLEYFEVAFGIGKINAINVGVNWRLTPGEMLHIIEDSQMTVLVVGQDFISHIEAIEHELTTVTSIVVIGEHDRWPSYERWIGVEPADDPMVKTSASDIAFLIFTSGTTGLPKGAMMNQFGFFAAFSALDRWMIDEDSVMLAMMPMFHFAGSGWSLLGLAVGAKIVLLPDVDPVRVLDAIPTFGITNIVLAPAVIQFMMMVPGNEDVDYSSLRAMVYGGSPISETTLQQATALYGCQFIQIYGLTETAGGVAQLDGVDHDPVNRPHLLRSCGKAFDWVELRIVGPDGNDVPEGEQGEFWVRAEQNMPGYWRNPEATERTITPDGWLKTGDVGVRDPEGFLFLKDRANDMVVSGAENIYPAEVENALMKHPAVADVAVIGVPDERWGEAVKAVVVKAEGHDGVTGEEIIAATREHLAGYKLPKSIDFATELARNPTGKLLRRLIREPYWAGHTRGIG